MAGTERGLLLTCLWYIREVDPATLLLTGLTRDGVYLVEGGEVVGEVDHNFRFNYSPLDVLRRAAEVGATERTLPAGVEGLVHPRGDAAGPGAGVQHVLGVAQALTPAVTSMARSPLAPAWRAGSARLDVSSHCRRGGRPAAPLDRPSPGRSG